MKLTQMIEKFAKQGMLNGVARAELLQAAEETEQEMAELQEALKGLDLEEVKAEAPYLFYEKTEKKKGTGAPMTRQKWKEDEIRAAFRRGLGR